MKKKWSIPNNFYRPRRVIYLEVTPNIFADFFKVGSFNIIESPIPKKAKFIAGYYETIRNRILILYEHKSFDEVRNGEIIPVISESEIKGEYRLKKK